jgi:hypothetical protein
MQIKWKGKSSLRLCGQRCSAFSSMDIYPIPKQVKDAISVCLKVAVLSLQLNCDEGSNTHF